VVVKEMGNCFRDDIKCCDNDWGAIHIPVWRHGLALINHSLGMSVI